jgi:hypothetical protein
MSGAVVGEVNVGTAVDLFVMGGGLRALPAVVIAREGDRVKMRVEGVTPGAAVFFQGESPGPWVYGRVAHFDADGVVVIQVQGQHRPDRREFARAWGPVHVRYQVVDEAVYELAARRWITRGEGIQRAWIQPELFMSFSGSGLRFGGGDAVDEGSRVLVGIRVPDDEREHRLTASVIRTADGDGTALHFLLASEGAVMALVRFAERIQERSLDELDGLV